LIDTQVNLRIPLSLKRKLLNKVERFNKEFRMNHIFAFINFPSQPSKLKICQYPAYNFSKVSILPFSFYKGYSTIKSNNGNHLGGGPVVRVWDQEVCSLCGLRFEPCGCSYDSH